MLINTHFKDQCWGKLQKKIIGYEFCFVLWQNVILIVEKKFKIYFLTYIKHVTCIILIEFFSPYQLSLFYLRRCDTTILVTLIKIRIWTKTHWHIVLKIWSKDKISYREITCQNWMPVVNTNILLEITFFYFCLTWAYGSSELFWAHLIQHLSVCPSISKIIPFS